MYEDEHLEADYEDRYTTLADWDVEDEIDFDEDEQYEGYEEDDSDMYDEWDTFYNTDLSRIMY